MKTSLNIRGFPQPAIVFGLLVVLVLSGPQPKAEGQSSAIENRIVPPSRAGLLAVHFPDVETLEPDVRPIWTNSIDEYTPPVAGEHGRATRPGVKTFKDYRTTVWRWRDDFQNDFASRMDWTIKPRAEANHPPSPALNHPDAITVRSGETFRLDSRGTSDPDGDSLSFFWFEYREAGTCPLPLRFTGAENLVRVNLTAPKVEQAATAHVILRVTDKGIPPLSRYKRVIVTIVP